MNRSQIEGFAIYHVTRSCDAPTPAARAIVNMLVEFGQALLVEVEIPPQKPKTGWAMVEVARRPHDFALVGVVAVVRLNDKDECEDAKLVLFSVGEGPVEAHKAVDVMIGIATSPTPSFAAFMGEWPSCIKR